MSGISRRWTATLAAAILVLFHGWTLHGTEAIVFPIDQIRIPILFNSIINVATPSVAWFVLGLAIKIALVGFYLGLPRNPPRPDIRRSVRDFNSPANSSTAPDVGFYLDVLVELDTETCLSRLICHLQSLPEEELHFFQKIALDAIWSSSSLDKGYSPISSPRMKLINAAYFGKSTRCSSCCKYQYKKCSASTNDLLSLL